MQLQCFCSYTYCTERWCRAEHLHLKCLCVAVKEKIIEPFFSFTGGNLQEKTQAAQITNYRSRTAQVVSSQHLCSYSFDVVHISYVVASELTHISAMTTCTWLYSQQLLLDKIMGFAFTTHLHYCPVAENTTQHHQLKGP